MRIPSMKINSKLFIIVAVASVTLVIPGSVALRFTYNQMIADRTAMVSNLFENGITIATSLQKNVEAGKMRREQAIREFRDRPDSMRFCKHNDYGSMIKSGGGRNGRPVTGATTV